MRIAVVYDCLFPLNTGGGERVYRRLAELLVSAGHHVDYLTRNQWEEEPPETAFALVPVWRGDIYDAAGTRTIGSALAFGAGVFRTLVASRGRYDIVISSALPVTTLLAARLALVGTRTWLVGDWLEVWSWQKWRSYSGKLSGTLAFLIQAVGLRAASLNSADSRFTAQRIVKARPRTSPLVMGLIDLVDSHTTLRPREEPPYVLVVGRLIPDKRTTAIPAAIMLAEAEIPGLTVKIVGTGPEANALDRSIAHAGASARVSLLGRVDDDELDALFAGAAALVNASAREGFGLVVAEAASHGVPSVVVAGEDNAAVDLIESDINGLVSVSASAADLAEAIVSVVSRGDDLRASTFAWFESAKHSAGLARSVEELLALYPRAR